MNKACMVLVLIASTAGCAQAPPQPSPGATESQALSVTFPAGDPLAGRQTFLDLGCASCHALPSEPGIPPPISASPGPPIDARLASRAPSYLVTAIVSPSHQLSADMDEGVRARLVGVLSPMGDYSQSMTVRQLVDIHAYLRSMK